MGEMPQRLSILAHTASVPEDRSPRSRLITKPHASSHQWPSECARSRKGCFKPGRLLKKLAFRARIRVQTGRLTNCSTMLVGREAHGDVLRENIGFVRGCLLAADLAGPLRRFGPPAEVRQDRERQG